MEYTAVVLAAGKGVRMRSELPKLMHKVAGKPMILHLVDTIRKAGVKKIILVLGHGKEHIEELFKDNPLVNFAYQEEQLGTGHALMQAQKQVDEKDNLLVLAGDTPLLQASTLINLIAFHESRAANGTILSTLMEEPYGYGRIVRGKDEAFQNIVEEKDASAEEKQLREINSGMYCISSKDAYSSLAKLDKNNKQSEYYLTDIFKILLNEDKKVEVYLSDAKDDVHGINNRIQLAQAEKILRQRKNLELMESGVTLIDPSTTFIDIDVEISSDTLIMPFTIIEGISRIGKGCQIGPSTHICSSQIGDDVVIENSKIKEAKIGDSCNIGPFAYLRPGSILHKGVKIGDFVEIKNSIIGEESKVPHLSYIGDAQLGKNVNIGAGTITCNYDGKNKYQTILEDEVFIGSNTNLVAPIKLGRKAVTGAGSTISKNVPEGALAIERAEQKIIEKWEIKKET